MKSLLILRHAKSSWNDPSVSDHDRPLNQRGKHDAPRMGQLIKQQNLTPDVILCSTARRAHKTALHVARHCDFPAEVQPVDEFYLAHPQAYLDVLCQQPDEVSRALVVGHNPGLEDLLSVLTGVNETMPTAGLAHVQLAIDKWQQLDTSTSGELIQFWRPRELE